MAPRVAHFVPSVANSRVSEFSLRVQDDEPEEDEEDEEEEDDRDDEDEEEDSDDDEEVWQVKSGSAAGGERLTSRECLTSGL